ncbi:MAG: DUF6328 family protein [Acidimicrobiia bacterium]|nr:DUF6328 family protein [Acidimicrobiia bacterium]
MEERTPEASRPDSDEADVDDQFRALLEGLRTTIPGALVLFSFLLILPLEATFGDITDLDTIVFYVAFISAGIASTLLIAPSVHQRVRAPISGIRRTTWNHVMIAAKLTIAGTAFLLISVSAVVYLVTSLVFTPPFAVAATIVVAGVTTWAWFYLPLFGFSRDS